MTSDLVRDRSWAAAHTLRAAADALERDPSADPVKFLRDLADHLDGRAA